MDWVLVLGIVGAIWAIVALTWRRGGGRALSAPSGAWASAAASPRAPASPKIYGYGEDDFAPLRPTRLARRTEGRSASADVFESLRRAAETEALGADLAPQPMAPATVTPLRPISALEFAAAPVLPIRIADYEPGEQVVIQYVAARRDAPQPELTAHQVGADVELRLSGITVAVLEQQDARPLIEQNLLSLVREEEAVAPDEERERVAEALV